MYRILVDGSTFCDSRIEDLAIINPIVKLAVNTAGSFTCTVPPEHPKYNMINLRRSIVSIYLDDDTEPIFQGFLVSEEIDFYKRKKMTFEGELAFLNDTIQRPARISGFTSRQLLERYILDHNDGCSDIRHTFQVGQVTARDSNDYISCYTNYNSTWQEIKEDLLDDIGGYLRIRHVDGINYLDYLKESPRTSDQVIELGKNLVDYKSNLDTVNIYSTIIPLGAKQDVQEVEGLDSYLTVKSVNDGKDYVFRGSIAEVYGFSETVVHFDGITTPQALMNKAIDWLMNEQYDSVYLEISAVDFGMISDNFNKFKLLDKIRVVSQAHSMDKYFMLTEQTFNLNNPENNTIKLGAENIKSMTARTNTDTQQLKSKLDNVTTSDVLKNAIANASQLIRGVDGGNVVINSNEDGHPYELLIMDTDEVETATKVWRWNQNGLGYSSTGYNGSYSTAITSDGSIVASFITTGKLSCDRLEGGTIRGQKFVGTNRTQLSENVQGLYIGNDGLDFSWKMFDDWEAVEKWMHFRMTSSNGFQILVGSEVIMSIGTSARMGGVTVGNHVTMSNAFIDNTLAVEGKIVGPNGPIS